MRVPAGVVAALLIGAWLASLVPGSWPAALPHLGAEWSRHLAAGWPPVLALVPYALAWLLVGDLLRGLPGANHAWRTLALLAAVVLAVRFTWLAASASNAEFAGAVVALAGWPLAERIGEPMRARLLAVLVAGALVFSHLLPLVASGHGHGIHWLPFTDVAPAGAHLLLVARLAAKLFWIGGLVWLLVGAGLGPFGAGLAAAGALLLGAAARASSAPDVQYVTMTDPAVALLAALLLRIARR